LYARRCLFRRKNGVLLVTEVFLPAIANVHAPGKAIENIVPIVDFTMAQTPGGSLAQLEQSI
jgi:hypothetical protein